MNPSLVRTLRLLGILGVLFSSRAAAQTRERPVAFDSAGRVASITPPLAARLGLTAPVWPVTGDFIDARLYVIDSAGTSFVLVARRPQDILDRYLLTLSQRRELAAAVERGNTLLAMRPRGDTTPTVISEPVRSSFVVHQTLLGGLLFGPAASALFDDGAAASAAYLAVTGISFFSAANISQSTPVSRAQNHLSWHSARRGAIATSLLTYAVAGGRPERVGYASAVLAGGIAGDIIGFKLGEPMTDAEAHGTSHGSTVTAALTAGVLGTAGMFEDETSGRPASAVVVGLGALGYPLGLRYVRAAPYTVTAGDMGTLVTSEFLGMAAAAAFLPDGSNDERAVYGALTAGFAAGAILGDRFLVKPFDHTEAEARLVQYGAAAGALVALAVPVLTQVENTHVVFGAGAAGGILGAMLTEKLITPRRAGQFGSLVKPERRIGGVDIRVTPEALAFAGFGLRGNHSLLSVTF